MRKLLLGHSGISNPVSAGSKYVTIWSNKRPILTACSPEGITLIPMNPYLLVIRATNAIQIVIKFYFALVNRRLVVHNSGSTCLIGVKQILFGRAMTGLSPGQPMKTSSL